MTMRTRPQTHLWKFYITMHQLHISPGSGLYSRLHADLVWRGVNMQRCHEVRSSPLKKNLSVKRSSVIQIVLVYLNLCVCIYSFGPYLIWVGFFSMAHSCERGFNLNKTTYLNKQIEKHGVCNHKCFKLRACFSTGLNWCTM